MCLPLPPPPVRVCSNGHRLTPENTYRWRGREECRVCRKAARRRFKQRERGEF
jgi:hypothetical protein